MTDPIIGKGLRQKNAKATLNAVKTQIPEDEHILGIFSATKLSPLLNSLVITNSRLIGAQMPKTNGVPLVNEIAGDDIKSVEVPKRMLLIHTKGGKAIKYATIRPKDSDTIVELLNKVSGSPSPLELGLPRKSGGNSVLGWAFLLIVSVFSVWLIGALLTPPSKDNASHSRSSAQAKMATIGQPANDAGFKFIVNSIKCGETHIQTSGYVYTYSDAQGQFCRLNITITNITNSANSIGVSAQYLFNSQGQKYDSDSDATATAANAIAGSPLNAEVNPGNSVTGDIVYDVPVGVTPTLAELHGDYGSTGVRVNLQ